ncbi:unnamed protein product [Clonostachys rosea]|uniref:F-box domain-containing protein n=1 Tax=Bionectria ochroleuca TaxID=29856 RepID=A0ABY6U6W0_BIOOC|nr:unnamed protein product [Clonostachys rosea]
MARLDTLPLEILLQIAETCTWGVLTRHDRENEPGNETGPQSRCRYISVYYGRYHAALARVNRRFYDVLNASLYKRNLLHDSLVVSCVLWAAKFDRLETLQVAVRYGADLDRHGRCKPGAMQEAVPLHVAIAAGHSRVVEFMLDHGANVHIQSTLGPDERKYADWDFYGWSSSKNHGPRRQIMHLNKAAYPLYTALENGTMEDAARLIDHGAYMIAKGTSVLRILDDDDKRHRNLIEKVSQRTDAVTLRALLHRAAAAHDVEMVRKILTYKIHAGDLDRQRRNALHMVILGRKRENLPLIELLLQRPDIDATMEDNDDLTPILAAVSRGHVNTVKRLLQVPRVVLSGLGPGNRTALHLAAKTGNLELIECVLNQPDIDLRAISNSGHCALTVVSDWNREDKALAIMNLLLANGVTIPHLRIQSSILFKVIHQRHMRIALLLLRNGLIKASRYLDQSYHDQLTLHVCLKKPHELLVDVLTELIAQGVSVNQLEPVSKRSKPKLFRPSPLYRAATGAKSLECMKLLVDAGAVIKDTAENRSTILLNVFFHVWGKEPPSDDPDTEAYTDRICLLLENGATIGRQTAEPVNTALGYACEASTDESFRLLALLLDNSTAANVDATLVRALIAYYGSDEKQGEAKAKKIARRLEAFETNLSSVPFLP